MWAIKAGGALGTKLKLFGCFGVSRSLLRGTGLNKLHFLMKTIPVSLIMAGILSPAITLAEEPARPPGPPPGEAGGRPSPPRPFVDAWQAADTNRDGFLSKDEFDAISRIQNLPEDKRVELFKRLDKDQDGKLAREELGRMGFQHGEPMRRFWELDVNKSGGVSFEEFKAGPLFSKLPAERLEAVFHRLDSNGDGMISPKDKPEHPMKREDGRFHPRRPDGGDRPDGPRMEPRQIIRQLDQNGDGALSFEEFRVGPATKDLTEDEQEDRFEKMDRNHDLKLTAEDFPPPTPRGDQGRPKPPMAPKSPQGPPPSVE